MRYITWALWSILSGLIVSNAAPIDDPSSYSAGEAQSNVFDYVVIGGGNAGLVIATRLAQAARSVAVIEAGGFYEKDVGNLSSVPAYAIYGAGASPDDVIPSVDWGIVTAPQPGMNNRRLHYARGKTLGGSSARNYFTYQRPTVGSLSQWASSVGDDSYSYENFLPYYKKSVNYTPPNNSVRPRNASVPSSPDAFTPGAGPLRVSFSVWANSFSSFVSLAWQKLGVPVTQDFVCGTLDGVQYAMNTIDPNGQVRDSSYSSFLRSLPAGSSIKVFNNTMAKRILFNSNKAAVGVTVDSGAGQYNISATREVILSAGAFQSPQLLMVSGIGPANTLRKFGIPIISQLAGVGQNLEDHLLITASYRVATLTHSALGNQTYLNAAKTAYNTKGNGMLSNPGGEIIAWEKVPAKQQSSLSNLAKSTLSSYPSDWPHYEHLALDAYSGDNLNYLTGAPKTPFMYASPSAAVMVPQSKGNITITSRDTSDKPVVSPNWLTSAVDQELAIAMLRRIREMMDTDVMKGLSVEELVPGRSVSTDAAILNAIRNTAIQMFHASATCKMGKSSDSQAVVDSKARVFGVSRLRVVDASAFPFLPPGHPQATVYALAEKIVDDILRSY